MNSKKLLTSLFFILAINLCNAQRINKIGLHTGIVLSQQRQFLTEPEYKIESQAILGLMTKIKVPFYTKNDFTANAELGFIQKRSKSNFESFTINHLENTTTVNTGTVKNTNMSFLSLSADLE